MKLHDGAVSMSAESGDCLILGYGTKAVKIKAEKDGTITIHAYSDVSIMDGEHACMVIYDDEIREGR